MSIKIASVGTLCRGKINSSIAGRYRLNDSSKSVSAITQAIKGNKLSQLNHQRQDYNIASKKICDWLDRHVGSDWVFLGEDLPREAIDKYVAYFSIKDNLRIIAQKISKLQEKTSSGIKLF